MVKDMTAIAADIGLSVWARATCVLAWPLPNEAGLAGAVDCQGGFEGGAELPVRWLLPVRGPWYNAGE